MSHYNMHIGYPTSNSRGGQPDAPATTRAVSQPLVTPLPIRAPPPPSAPPPQGIMPPMMRQECQRPPPPCAPSPKSGLYTFEPVQHGPLRQAQNTPGRPANPPLQAAPANPSYLTYTPIAPRNAAPPPQAYDCTHKDCKRRVMVASVRDHMWRAHGVLLQR